MIINSVCVIMEAFSVFLCIHYLYNVPFRMDTKTTLFMSLYVVYFGLINYFHFPLTYTMVMYFLVCIYCGVKFGFRFKELLVNNILYIVVVSGIQSLVVLLSSIFISNYIYKGYQVLIINLSVLLIILFIRKIPIYRFAYFLIKTELWIKILITIGASIVLGYMVLYKFQKITTISVFIPILVVIFIYFIISEWEKYRIRAKELEKELQTERLYAKSFEKLISDIRLKQHEYDNHINTIYSQQYIYKTYDELVKAQSDYCKQLKSNTKFAKVLSSGNPVLIGFLYTQFLDIDQLGIEVNYKLQFRNLECGLQLYQIIEIVGNLLDNAVEALETQNEKKKKIYVGVIENETEIELIIRNTSSVIEIDEVTRFFKKGYSTKGNSRGMGLYHVKRICKENKIELETGNQEIDKQNWFGFRIIIQKAELL